jgi:hypothetical protein
MNLPLIEKVPAAPSLVSQIDDKIPKKVCRQLLLLKLLLWPRFKTYLRIEVSVPSSIRWHSWSQWYAITNRLALFKLADQGDGGEADLNVRLTLHRSKVVRCQEK